ncbi:MAG: hypothetical protein AB1599_10485 [Planctomycetota bacterium]
MIYQYAIVRSVAKSYDRCIKPFNHTEPVNVRLAQRQHRAYCRALKDLGLKLINL